MTIEQKMLHDYGTTGVPELCMWLLRDGTMVNGSWEGHQRDVDHREVSQYFKRSKREDPGSAAIYIYKFERRGNIRVTCSDFGYGFELYGPPSREQLAVIFRCAAIARRNSIPVYIDRRIDMHRRRGEDLEQFRAYLRRYTGLLAA